ncbi:MAG: dinitrogenase iron-molybdenum cofactor biosynthesis protein [Deltaproteobacteria bacterium]|nr:dinitrogenase iron-molybdenum cofactor biosynthesis protein [Deltaproteobacteria bacterium]
MKIAISAQGPELTNPVDTRFGRARGFVVYDLNNDTSSFVDNDQNLGLAQGAGIQSAQNVARTGATAVITGNVGPKAFLALEKGGIAVYLTQEGTVQDAVTAFKEGRLETASGATKPGHW